MDDLKKLRELLNSEDCPFSCPELSSESGVDEGTISKIKNGHTKNPGILTVDALLAASEKLTAAKSTAVSRETAASEPTKEAV